MVKILNFCSDRLERIKPVINGEQKEKVRKSVLKERHQKKSSEVYRNYSKSINRIKKKDL